MNAVPPLRPAAAGLLAPLLLLLSACSGGAAAPSSPSGERSGRPLLGESPRPTEHWLDEEAEERQGELRRAWFEERHKAPPDVDWREVERRNGLAQMDKRNALADQRAALAPNWVERGSENNAGRMHAAVLSSDGLMLYAGSSLGGVWRGSLDGTGWSPIGDNLAGGAHYLAVVAGATPSSPRVVLAASNGGLVHVTRDEGRTWQVPVGLPSNLREVLRIRLTSDGTETIVILVRNASNQRRLYRSTDAAATFQLVDDMGGYAGDVWTPRTGFGDLYLLRSNGVYKSTDHGASWSLVGSLGISSNGGDLVGSEAGAPRLWAIVNAAGTRQLHRSDDGGATWTYLSDVTDYWGSLAASIVDPDLFAYGGVEVHRTDDAGASFAIVNPWYEYYGDVVHKLHADVPGIEAWPDGAGGEIWYVATDGGLFHSDDGLATVTNLSLNGLRVSQYYSTLTSAAVPDRVMAGAQDQGYQLATAGPPPEHGRLDFDQLISGDYGHLTSGHGTPQYTFSTYPGFVLAHVQGAGAQLFQVSFPPGETNAWMPPVVVDPGNPKSFFFAASKLWHYAFAGANTWTRTQFSAQDFGASPGEYMSALVFSPVDPLRAYAVTNNGRLFHSSDGGVTWTQSAQGGPGGQYFYGTALIASSLDADTAWVGGTGYQGHAVWQTVDGGASWTGHGTGLPSTLVYCLGEAPDGSGKLFCGTETSAYARDPGAPSWLDITGNDAPITVYWSVEPLPSENTMRFGTYGRGIWDYRLDASLPWDEYGCGVNPAGSFAVLAGTPAVGQSLTLGVDNPWGTQRPGSVSAIVLSAAPSFQYPCGLMLPGFGMAGAGMPGELLVALGSFRLTTLVGSLWSGPGTPALTFLPIPNDPALVGSTLWAQGLLYDPFPAPVVRTGLTVGLEIPIGP